MRAELFENLSLDLKRAAVFLNDCQFQHLHLRGTREQ